jgi:hypothetical protein
MSSIDKSCCYFICMISVIRIYPKISPLWLLYVTLYQWSVILQADKHNCIDSWFQTFAVFWMSYAFFWVIHRRLSFKYQRFGTLCLFHLHRRVVMKYTSSPMKMEQTKCSEMLAFNLQTPVNHPEESTWQCLMCFIRLIFQGRFLP